MIVLNPHRPPVALLIVSTRLHVGLKALKPGTAAIVEMRSPHASTTLATALNTDFAFHDLALNIPGRVGGVYNTFYQHYPHTPRWADMHWGPATSGDLIQWTHQPILLVPGMQTTEGAVLTLVPRYRSTKVRGYGCFSPIITMVGPQRKCSAACGWPKAFVPTCRILSSTIVHMASLCWTIFVIRMFPVGLMGGCI